MDKRTLAALVIVIGLAGCKLGPDYRPPELELPSSFSPGKDGEAHEAALARWWREFRDPVLDRLVGRAAGANHDLRITLARVRQARAQRRIERAAGLPAIDASGRYQQSRQSENVGFGGGPGISGGGSGTPGGFEPGEEEEFWQAGFDASWEIDLFGGVRRAVEAAGAEVGAREEDARDVLVSLLAELARAYIELRAAQRQWTLTQDGIRSQEDTLALTRARFQAGVTGELDVAQAEAQVASTRASLPPLEAEAERAMHRLAVLTGLAPRALVDELRAEAPIPAPPSELALGLPSQLLRRRPDVRRAERSLHAATARIGAAKADLLPRLTLTGAFGFESDKLSNLGRWDSRVWSWGPRLRWPIFAAGSIAANIEVQNARQEEALQAYERAVLIALEDVENAVVNHQKERRRLDDLVAAVAASRRALAMARELYTKGLIDFLNVLQAERSVLDLEVRLAQSQSQLASAAVALYKALGGGWEMPVDTTSSNAATSPG
jgi:NodT family efflux transporter outer membrane factor (OMF) lipoprotein